MQFTITPAQSAADHAFFIEQEYHSAKENGMLLNDRSTEEARQTFITDLEGYLQEFNHHQVYIARTRDGRSAGMIWLGQRTGKEPWDFSESSGWIYDIRVLPEYRRSGIGGALLTTARDWAKQAGFQRIGLHVYGANTAAIKLYLSNGYQALYQYLQKDLTPENLSPAGSALSFRAFQASTDQEFTRSLLFRQYRQLALASANPDETAVAAGFEKALETFNFGSPKKELVIAEDAWGTPAGLLWFYQSKGDLGKRRYIWLHAALAEDAGQLHHLLGYVEHWALTHDLDAIRTPLHYSESQAYESMRASGYAPANIFMFTPVSA